MERGSDETEGMEYEGFWCLHDRQLGFWSVAPSKDGHVPETLQGSFTGRESLKLAIDGYVRGQRH